MKIRDGFVSNSSSSSFIVATDDKNPKITVTLTADSRFFDHKASTIKQLEKAFLDQFGYNQTTIKELLEEDDFYQANWDECVAAIKSGKTVFFGSCSNEDDSELSLALYQAENPVHISGNSELLYGELELAE